MTQPPSVLSDDDRAVLAAYDTTELSALRRVSSPLPDVLSPILICVVRDERDALADFLRHYRGGGVERFVFIDNGSTDGTIEYLLRQLDVDLFQVNAPFDWRRKQAWINRAIDYYGLDRWYLYVDADEHITFDGFGPRGFPDLAELMERAGQLRVRGFLLDMYSDLPLLAGAGGDDMEMIVAYPYFDRAGYTENQTVHLISRTGGPRARAFAAADAWFNPQLTKYPMFRLRPGEFMANPHHIWPCAPNHLIPCTLAILHFKFHGDWPGRVARAVMEGNYWEGSREYKAYLKMLEATPFLSLMSEISRRFNGPGGLVEEGLIAPIAWADDVHSLTQVKRRSARAARANRLSAISATATADKP